MTTGTSTELDPLSRSILLALADAPRDGGVSLPRLGKQLGQGASVLMRQLTLMGDATLGGVRGPGWVRVVQLDDRWVVHLEAPGRALVDALPPEEAAS